MRPTDRTPDVGPEAAATAARAHDTVLLLVGLLVALGTLAIFSATGSTPGHVADPHGFLRRQIAWSVIGVLVLILVGHTAPRTLCRFGPFFLGSTVLLLIAVLVAGNAGARNGAARWLRIGPVGFQPSEAAKLAIIVFLAWIGGRADRPMADFRRGFLPAVGTLALVAGLVLVEPDVGTAIFLAVTGLAIVLVAGANPRHLFPVAAAAIPLALIFALLRFDHVKARLLVYLDPSVDPLGKGHQIRQSLLALGSGGLFGTGPGQGHQQLLFLPEGRNDFVLALIGEEFGFAGTVFVVGAFVMIVHCGRRIMQSAPDRQGFLLAFGATLFLGLQAAMNVAVVTATIPNKGISLPFVSYGGSSLVFSFAAVGILLAVARSTGPAPRPPAAARRPTEAAVAMEPGETSTAGTADLAWHGSFPEPAASAPRGATDRTGGPAGEATP